MACGPHNGRLPRSRLAPIPGGFLRRDAAAAWNAMSAEAIARGLTRRPLTVNGADSSYRIFARQVFWKRWWCARGRCGNAATPGCSNHGEGIAVDVPPWVRAIIDQIGREFGWAKEWSDAPGESWHLKWRTGIWHGEAEPVDPLTERERRLVTELAKIRRGHGEKWNEAELARANAIKAWIRTQRQLIRKAARKSGWNQANRRARHAALGVAYKG